MVEESARQAIRRLAKHLPAQNDLILIVLKGHLLIEGQLWDVLRSRVAKPDAVDEAKLGFWKLARVVKALVGPEAPDWLWAAVDDINTIRNRMAHQLEPPGLHELAERFLSRMDLSTGDLEALGYTTLPERIKAGIAYTCGALLRLVRSSGDETAA